MRFTTQRSVTAAQADAILAALRRRDAYANLRVDALAGSLRISGSLAADQVAAALRESGCEAVSEAELEVEAGGCCGGCA